MTDEKRYTQDQLRKANDALPQIVVEACKVAGWNAFGIYELVKNILATDFQAMEKMTKDLMKENIALQAEVTQWQEYDASRKKTAPKRKYTKRKPTTKKVVRKKAAKK